MWVAGAGMQSRQGLREAARDVGRVAAIGWLPRVLSTGLFVVSFSVALAVWLGSGELLIPLMLLVPTAAILVFSWRVKAWMRPDAFVLRGYFGTRVMRYVEVDYFTDFAYSGMWNRGADTDSWLNLGFQMIEVTYRNGRWRTLRATLCRRAACARLVEELNRRIDAVSGED